MSTILVQASFNSGEWAPSLYSRVDLQKYHTGAALLRNFFVDYRGGASTRVGTRYVLKAFKSSTAVRLIAFQASKSLAFTMEFGDSYVRFHRNGAPVLEAGINITGVALTNPITVTAANTYANGDWVYIASVGGTTQINGKYFIVANRTPTQFTLTDLFGVPVNPAGYGAYTAGGTAQRVFTLASPYAAADLALVKFAQNVDVVIFCHPNYAPYILTYTSATSWTFVPITFGTTISAPTTNGASSTLGSGAANYAYLVTAVDSSGQESQASSVLYLNNLQDIRTVAGTNYVNWFGVSGAQSYNVYRSEIMYGLPVLQGSTFGYIGNTTGANFADSNIAPDFSVTPPILQTPFITGSSVQSVTITNQGSYTTAPTVTFAAPGGGGVTATGQPVFSILTAPVAAGGVNYVIGDIINLTSGVQLRVLTLAGSAVATTVITNVGSVTATLPGNPVAQVSTNGVGTGATFNLTWGVTGISLILPGTNYSAAPAVSFSAGAAAGTASLSTAGYGFPSVPTFFQQRLALAGTNSAPQILILSQPGNYYNFNISSPVQSDDAITANIVSAQLNNIKGLISLSGGLVVVTDGVSFLVNGGGLGTAVTPSSIVANQQSYVGSSDVPPIVSNYDILTVPSKGSSVRDSTYNFYVNIFTGSDISIIASHLFYGYQLLEWCWAEEPYKVVWAVRNDGALLSLTFIKEQDFTAWAHHDTEGSFKSICTIVEAASVGYQNFVYTVVARTVNGAVQQYVEYMPERNLLNGVANANTVDCSYTYSGAPATTFTGATALAGTFVTGLADGVVIPSFTMPADGSFTLTTPASKVTIGLAFLPQLQTLYLDTGAAESVQGKQKKIANVTLRVSDTLGLQAGTTFSNLVDVKDLVVGNVGSMTNQVVSGLVTGDVRPWLDPKWNEAGQYCFQQTYPFPATILGVFPSIVIGDTAK